MSDLTTGSGAVQPGDPRASRASLLRQLPLGAVRAIELRGLLDHETAHWRDELLWDFADVASAVVQGLNDSRLDGIVLLDETVPVGYCYVLQEGQRLVVGSIFVVAHWRTLGLEERMVRAALSRAQRSRVAPRVEGQTLFCTSPGVGEEFRRVGFRGSTRYYMVRPSGGVGPGDVGPWRFVPLGRGEIARVAELVYRSHVGSPDAALNSTYATAGSCRDFVESIVLRCGCGTFDRDSSFLAYGTDGLAGVILCTTLGGRNGHVCQVSVRPERQGQGLGRRLMEVALTAHCRQGLDVSSLSVTVSNKAALQLYEHLGFRVRKTFEAYAWCAVPGPWPA